MMPLGEWREDKRGLPCFAYTGELPYRATLPTGEKVKLPEDPWFLLGNDHLTLFAHVSGEYEIISGQRAWARLNQGKTANSAQVDASICFGDRRYPLTGLSSVAADPSVCTRIFGCGSAEWRYRLDELLITRSLCVKPPRNIGGGASVWEMSVRMENVSAQVHTVLYTEAIGINIREIQYQSIPESDQCVHYDESVDNQPEQACISIHAWTEDPLLFQNREEMSVFETFPPTAFMKLESAPADTSVRAEGQELVFTISAALDPGEILERKVLIGFTYEKGQDGIDSALKAWKESAAWEKLIPTYEQERDPELRKELRWHFYTLEAMATWSDYYQETKIPQGTIYDYHWGVHASARDNLQHALPMVYDHPALAKSVLRYLMKRTTVFGEVRLIERGFGYAEQERYNTSDQQLFFFFLLSEYLRVTKDADFLSETVQPYPVRNTASVTVLHMIKNAFIYLRDTVGVGPHGLVRLLNSDWNDTVFYINRVPYSTVVLEGESHMNSAMVLALFPRLIQTLSDMEEKLPQLRSEMSPLLMSMRLYERRIAEAFFRDWGEHPFPARMYFDNRCYGRDQMFLEPMGYTLMIPALPAERKAALYREMKSRLYDGEKLGAREQEKPEFESEHYEKGSRENGGFWYALNGPVIAGLRDFDRAEAWRRLRQMTLKNMADQFPAYWSSWWSAADNQESSLMPGEGLPDQTEDYAAIPVFCAHPHAWILYCWHILQS